jgi:hypothetical protein
MLLRKLSKNIQSCSDLGLESKKKGNLRMELEKKNSRFALLLIAMLWAVGAQAITISNPIDYTTTYLVGTAYNGSVPTVANELIWANQILAMGSGETTTLLDVDYRTHDTDDYTGVLTSGVKVDGGSTMIGAGYEYAMAKYDGGSAGSVLFWLGGMAASLPPLSDSIWVNENNGKSTGYALSHYTVFGETDCCERQLSEPGTLGLMMIGMMGVGASRFRRRRSAK